ncbi:uncharacterized protein SAPINGB_P006298 [Magnusiomyces paraingens]|uniref:Eukaryotic translation initiation factor 3 subunit E n=1 Tax=Magnusiomyces paraingens TaxID=2606893 RepID=A0A5E8CBB5_9ASCO|nr:uncharacterized protein SAPINGB_P006298 [Saprochaete ingens]VVT58616.1 unnamed protein product [Saprochaete ingens]
MSTAKTSPEALELARKYDLTQTIIPFLDPHLVYPIAEFLGKKGIYSSKALDQLQYDLFKDSCMFDFINDLWKKLNPSESALSLDDRRADLDARIATYERDLTTVSEAFENPEVQANLKADKVQNLRMLEKYNITVDLINSFYFFGKANFSCGDYAAASRKLHQFLLLSTDAKLIASAHWGKFASDLLAGETEAALEDQQSLRDIVDQRSFADPLTQLHNRTWIIHWSLFLLQNPNFNKEGLVDLFFSASYISTIQAACPWIIRYLAAAVISLNTKGRNNSSNQRRLKDLVRVVGQELYEYQDPITDFVRALYIDYDFAEAQSKLLEAESILANDFFLHNLTDSFLDSARHLVSELYCRIHQRIDVKQLSARLNLSPEQGEKWIANLIKDTKMDAKINESDGTVIMNHPVTSVYQQVIEKTKGLTFRSNQILAQALNKNESVVA